jgi:lambda family phage portal protein
MISWIKSLFASSQPKAETTDARPHFRGARLDERWARGFNPAHRNGDSATRGSWSVMQARMRDMVDNDPTMKRPSDVVVTMGCGKGPLVLACVLQKSNSLVPKLEHTFNFAADEHWERWGKRNRIARLFKVGWREWVNTGNVLVVRYRNTDGSPGYQIKESEQLDRRMDRARSNGQNEISHGIEYDAAGKPVFYHFYKSHPNDDHAMAEGQLSEAVPADRVKHLYIPTRGSQRFGIPFHQAMMRSAADGDFLVGTELTSAAVAALFTAVIKTADDGLGDEEETQFDDGQPNEDANGNTFKKLGPGTVARLQPGEDVQTITSGRPNKAISEFLRFLWLINSQATGISYHRMTGDVAGASYTSLRAAMLDDSAYIEPLQQAFFDEIVEPMRLEVDQWGVGTGQIPVSAVEYLQNPERYQALEIVGPGQDWLQPDQEVEATKAAIACGLTSLPVECGRWGRHWLKNLRDAAMVKAACTDLDITLDFSKGNGGKPTDGAQPEKKPAPRKEAV